MAYRYTRIMTSLIGAGCAGAVGAYVFRHNERLQSVPVRVQQLLHRSDAAYPPPLGTEGSNGAPSTALEHDPPLVATSAQALTGDIVDAVLRDQRTIDNVVTLIRDVFTDDVTIDHLKQHFKAEFTTNKETVDALNKFLLQDVVQDPYVSEQLIGVAKDLGTFLMEHPHVYPGPTLQLLGDAALNALKSERFEREVTAALKDAGKYAVGAGAFRSP